jgi:hypothetical protein
MVTAGKHVFFLVFVFVFFKGFVFAKQALYHLSHAPSPFLLLLFFEWGGSHFIPRAGQDYDLLTYSSQCSWNDMHTLLCLAIV